MDEPVAEEAKKDRTSAKHKRNQPQQMVDSLPPKPTETV